jgi:hypothetical protein
LPQKKTIKKERKLLEKHGMNKYVLAHLKNVDGCTKLEMFENMCHELEFIVAMTCTIHKINKDHEIGGC